MCSIRLSEDVDINFAITNIILSKTGNFTIEDILNRSKELSINATEKSVKKMLNRLRENDYIEESGLGPTYRIIPEDKSMRWMGVS